MLLVLSLIVGCIHACRVDYVSLHSRLQYIFLVKVCQDIKAISNLQGLCQINKGMSRYQGYVTVSRVYVCQDIKDMSRYQGNVKISRICQNNKGMSN